MKEENADARLLHLRKLKELIEEYSEQGYEVFAEFRDCQRPRMIGNFKPDLIAKKGEREIIIEIASRSDMDIVKNKLEKFAEYADKERGRAKDVRFDIVLTNPRPVLSKDIKSESPRRLLKHTRQYLMRDVNAAYRRKQYTAAFYLLYDLLKSMFEEVAATKGALPPGSKFSLSQLNRNLLACGLVNKEDYNSVRKLVIARNLLVHKGLGFEIDKKYLESAREMAIGLVKNLE